MQMCDPSSIQKEHDIHSSRVASADNERRSTRKRKTLKAEKDVNYPYSYFRKARQDLPMKEKIKIIKMLETCPRVPQRLVASTFKVSQSQISRIQNNKEKFTKFCTSENLERKRNREGKGGQVEFQLLEWYKQAKEEGIPITGASLMEKAKNMAESMDIRFTPTSGWLGRWKKRHGITLKLTKSQEGRHILDKIISRWRRYTYTKIRKDRQTRIFFLGSLQILSNVLPCDVDSEQIGLSKVGILSLLFLFNFNGSIKKDPLVVGKEPPPLDGPHLNYSSQQKSIVTKDVFIKWLSKWDQELTSDERKVSLFLFRAPFNENIIFNSITLYYLPEGKNGCPGVHPFHLGISDSFKMLYKFDVASRYYSDLLCQSHSKLLERCTGSLVPRECLPLLDRLYMIQKAWRHIPPCLFAQAMVKAGLSKEVKSLNADSNICPPPGMNISLFKSFINMEDYILNSDDPEDAEGRTQTFNEVHVEEANALVACTLLKNYLQRNHKNLAEGLTEIESTLQSDLFTSKNGNASIDSCQNPFIDPLSIFNLKNHKNFAVESGALKPTDDLKSNNHSNATPSNSQKLKIDPTAVTTGCQIASLPRACGTSHSQYPAIANYIHQNAAGGRIPVSTAGSSNDNTQPIPFHGEPHLHPRSVGDVNSHIPAATPFANHTTTFIAFAS